MRRYCLLVVALAAAVQTSRTQSAATPEWTVRVVRVYPHDRAAFTQGLEYHDGFLYEGTGMVGRSSLRKVQLETGKVLQKSDLQPPMFGEGITLINQRIVQLTWQSHKGFVYSPADFKLLREFGYPGEGWGLTNDGKQIYMSDGTSEIRCWDATTLQEKRRIRVHEGLQDVVLLNELEYVKGEIYANVWQTDRIVRFSPADGRVTGWIEVPALLSPQERDGVDVLNGIAYDAARDRLFVTGKLWPKLFEIRLVHPNR